MRGLVGKTVLVTGAARGIGFGIACAMARYGCRVALLDLPNVFTASKSPAKTLEERYRTEAIEVMADVSDRDDLRRTFNQVVDHFGRIDIVVANAASSFRSGALHEMDTEQAWKEVRHTIDVTMLGTLHTCQLASTHMKHVAQDPHEYRHAYARNYFHHPDDVAKIASDTVNAYSGEGLGSVATFATPYSGRDSSSGSGGPENTGPSQAVNDEATHQTHMSPHITFSDADAGLGGVSDSSEGENTCPDEMPPPVSNGKIVVVGSIMSLFASTGRMAYTMSKSALNHMTINLAREMAPYRVNVNAVLPGYIDTEGERAMASREDMEIAARGIPWGRLGVPGDIGETVAFLSSFNADYITGSSLVVDGGYMCGLSMPFTAGEEQRILAEKEKA